MRTYEFGALTAPPERGKRGFHTDSAGHALTRCMVHLLRQSDTSMAFLRSNQIRSYFSSAARLLRRALRRLGLKGKEWAQVQCAVSVGGVSVPASPGSAWGGRPQAPRPPHWSFHHLNRYRPTHHIRGEKPG